MNVMVCGARSRFAEQIMHRLAKEENDIYHLTGTPKEDKANAPVFQEFRLSFLSDGIPDAIASSHPDVMIVMGAFDTAFTWTNPERDSVRYAPSIVNLLSAAKTAGVAKVIYLSTVNVYEANTEPLISRAVTPVATTVRGESLACAEQLCMSFADDRMEVIVVRLPEVFGARDDQTVDNVCLKFALDYLERGSIEYTAGKSHCAMYYEDAADIVFRITTGRKTDLESIMQFLGYRFLEEQLAEVLLSSKWNEGAKASKIDDYKGLSPLESIVDTQEEKIGAYLKFEFPQAISLLCKDCLQGVKHKKAESKERLLKILPFIESVVLCLIALAAQTAFSGSWVGENFNFFVIYVLILGVSYGTGHGLLSSLLAGASLLYMESASSSFIYVLTDFGFFVAILQVLVVGVISGFMRDKFHRQTKTQREENEYITTELSDMTKINESNLYVKTLYEKRLTDYRNSLSRVYQLVSALDYMQSQRVLFQAVNTVRNIMEVDDVALYTATGQSRFFRLSASSNARARMCGKTLRFDESNFLYEAIAHDEMFVNDTFEEGRPTYAHAVMSNGRILAIVMVWAKNIEQVNLYESNMLALMCRLIARAIERATQYEQAILSQTMIEGSNILKKESFLEVLALFQNGREQGLLPFETVRLYSDTLSIYELGRSVRETDFVGYIDGECWAILSNAEENELPFVVNRLASKNITVVRTDDSLLRDPNLPLTGETSAA